MFTKPKRIVLCVSYLGGFITTTGTFELSSSSQKFSRISPPRLPRSRITRRTVRSDDITPTKLNQSHSFSVIIYCERTIQYKRYFRLFWSGFSSIHWVLGFETWMLRFTFVECRCRLAEQKKVSVLFFYFFLLYFLCESISLLVEKGRASKVNSSRVIHHSVVL